MTFQDAIKEVKSHIICADYKDDDYIDCVKRETMIACMNALGKQIPKTPIIVNEDMGVFECQSCGGLIYATDELNTHKFCLMCGQAIDWSDFK